MPVKNAMGEREEKTEVNEISQRQVSIANGGPAHVNAVGRRVSRARGSIAKPSGSEMTFSDVCVDAGGKRILWSVSGKAVPGQMLAIMGPSGKITYLCTVIHLLCASVG